MTTEQPIYYVDSCCIIDLLQGTPDRIDALKDLFERSYQGQVHLFTSTLSIAEVAGLKHKANPSKTIPIPLDDAYNKLFKNNSLLTLVEPSRFIATEARDLIRAFLAKGETGLKGADAIHIASALRVKARVFYTYD